MFYVKNPELNEIDNYRFFLHYVFNKLPQFSSVCNNRNIFPDYYDQALKRLNPKLLYYFHQGKIVYQAIPQKVNFSQFLSNLNYHFIYQPHYNPMAYRSRFYTYHQGINFRQNLSFVKNQVNAHPKVLDQKTIQKNDWRISKGFDKDKSKRGGKKFDKPNKKFKQSCNRNFRHAQRQLIKEQKFEEVFDEQLKLYYDLWDWS